MSNVRKTAAVRMNPNSKDTASQQSEPAAWHGCQMKIRSETEQKHNCCQLAVKKDSSSTQ